MLAVALRAGIKKVKFLGGEPLISPYLPELVAYVKAAAPETDVSIITSGAAPRSRLEAAFAAGLDRANLSIHGWMPAAFARNGSQRCYALRADCLEYLLALGRALKLNYVYTGPEVEDDLAALLLALQAPRFAARRVVVSVLDELSHSEMSPDTIRNVLRRLCGTPSEVLMDEDPHSLPTERWRYVSGLQVEIKSSQLGEHAPWAVCTTCPRRQACREGTFALRLDPDGLLRYCMDRPDLGFSLLEACQTDVTQGLEAWHRQLFSLLATNVKDAA